MQIYECRAVCKRCQRTFLCDKPEEIELCWECGEGLIYVCRNGNILNEEDLNWEKEQEKKWKEN